MSRIDDGDAEGFWIAYSDGLLNIFMVITCMFALQAMLPHLKAKEDAAKDGVSPGRMCIEMYWPDTIDDDIDLWVRGPDGRIASYKTRSTPLIDLLRDDLGAKTDPAGKSYEMACSRTLKAGEWTVNASFYRANDGARQVPVKVVISFPDNDSGPKQASLIETTALHGAGEEQTVVDFELDASGHVVPGSRNSILQSLRN